MESCVVRMGCVCMHAHVCKGEVGQRACVHVSADGGVLCVCYVSSVCAHVCMSPCPRGGGMVDVCVSTEGGVLCV